MPTPGPVAYQPHAESFTDVVISTGFDQDTPSSSLRQIQTVRVARAVRRVMAFSLSLPRLCVSNSQTTPVCWSTTGHGLPQVFGPSSQITRCALQVLPPSVERLRSRSMSPASDRLFLRPSQNARRVSLAVAINA